MPLMRRALLLALLGYDFVLTLSDEVELIWRRKFSVASVIFVLNRATALLTCALLSMAISNPVRRCMILSV